MITDSPPRVFSYSYLPLFLPPLLSVVTCILDIISSLFLHSQLINGVAGSDVYSVGWREQADHLNMHRHVCSVPYPSVFISI
jgi:hypothetical protein